MEINDKELENIRNWMLDNLKYMIDDPIVDKIIYLQCFWHKDFPNLDPISLRSIVIFTSNKNIEDFKPGEQIRINEEIEINDVVKMHNECIEYDHYIVKGKLSNRIKKNNKRNEE